MQYIINGSNNTRAKFSRTFNSLSGQQLSGPPSIKRPVIKVAGVIIVEKYCQNLY